MNTDENSFNIYWLFQDMARTMWSGAKMSWLYLHGNEKFN